MPFLGFANAEELQEVAFIYYGVIDKPIPSVIISTTDKALILADILKDETNLYVLAPLFNISFNVSNNEMAKINGIVQTVKKTRHICKDKKLQNYFQDSNSNYNNHNGIFIFYHFETKIYYSLLDLNQGLKMIKSIVNTISNSEIESTIKNRFIFRLEKIGTSQGSIVPVQCC